MKKLKKWIFLLITCWYFSPTPWTFLISQAKCTTQGTRVGIQCLFKKAPKAVREGMLHVWGKKGSWKLSWSGHKLQRLSWLTCFLRTMREMEMIWRTLKGWYFVACSPYMEQRNCSNTSRELVFPAATGTAVFCVEEFVYTLRNIVCFVD